jgi:hypothetical protein
LILIQIGLQLKHLPKLLRLFEENNLNVQIPAEIKIIADMLDEETLPPKDTIYLN